MSHAELQFWSFATIVPLRPVVARVMASLHHFIPRHSTCLTSFGSTSTSPCAPCFHLYHLAIAVDVAAPSRSVAAPLWSRAASPYPLTVPSTITTALIGISWVPHALANSYAVV